MMKRIIATVVLGCLFIPAIAQPPVKTKAKPDPVVAVGTGCDNIIADLYTGRVNGLKPTTSMSAVKKKLPCFTGESTEGGNVNCGGGVFYLNNDIYFYTGRNYIELRDKFSGRTEPALLGTQRRDAVTKLGVADIEIDGGRVLIYKKPYGSLRLLFNMEGRCIEIGIHDSSPDKVELCE
ncbi:MAG: hypothetical protein M0D57_16400 [Sphingobacteriales bacterium JAD_PAG50586_3]|nr:MAG: hypothetical protein M0D57_16400 [Sphingobacteriales bacterium JAD_PAG50586_3]